MATSRDTKEFSKRSVTGVDDLQASQVSNQVSKNKKGSDKETMSEKAGDMLERAGEKIKNAGADSIGNAVYKTGNKLEHSQDSKKTTH